MKKRIPACPSRAFRDALKAAVLTSPRSRIVIARDAGATTQLISRIINGNCFTYVNDPRLLCIAFVINFPRENVFFETGGISWRNM